MANIYTYKEKMTIELNLMFKTTLRVFLIQVVNINFKKLKR